MGTNSYLSDDNGYSASLADIVDNLRSYLEIGNWQTDEMKALLTNYGFRMEYQGTSKADALSMAEGLCLGFKHRFSSIAFDNSTSDTSNGNTSGTKSGTVFFRGCGNVKKELKLSDREWTCETCGFNNQRDLHAAINI